LGDIQENETIVVRLDEVTRFHKLKELVFFYWQLDVVMAKDGASLLGL
jgi:hypothetical protein